MFTFWKVTMTAKNGKVMGTWIVAMSSAPPVFQAQMPGFLFKVMEKVKQDEDFHPEDFPGCEMATEVMTFNQSGVARLC